MQKGLRYIPKIWLTAILRTTITNGAYSAERKYYNAYSILVNDNYLNRFPKYKCSAHNLYTSKCILEYLRIYEKYPQVELLLKAGISSYLATKITLLKKLDKDKNFRKWIMENKKDMQDSFYSVKSIMTAYAKNLTIYKAQKTEQRLNELKSSYRHALIADVINGDWVKFLIILTSSIYPIPCTTTTFMLAII